MGVNIISPSRLLDENIRDGIFNDKLLRELVKPDDFIWQQMSWENFGKLFASKAFYFKAYSEYDDYDEKKLVQFRKDKEKTNEIREKLEKVEHGMFISCWYNSPDLSDIVFKQYTGLGGGIAIGTRVETLIECIKSKMTRYNFEFYAGNVQYLPQSQLDGQSEQLFERTQIIAPVFLKGLQFQMDREFRVCAYAEKETTPKYNSAQKKNQRLKNAQKHVKRLTDCIQQCKCFEVKQIERIDTDLKSDNKVVSVGNMASKSFKFGQFQNVIERIAIINIGICAELEESTIKELFKGCFKMDIESMPAANKNTSGFRIFKVIK